MHTSEHAVVIAGAGPTGLMLAAELTLAGVEALIVERRESQAVEGSRAGGLLPRTLEVLDQRGVVERFVAEGERIPMAAFGGARLALGDLPTPHAYWLALWQERIEHHLAQWVDELSVPILRRVEVTAIAQDRDGVDVSLSDGRVLRARYLVGCDGGRSVVRKQTGIAFPGWEPSVSYLTAECAMSDEPPYGLRYAERGVQAIGKLKDARVRVVLAEPRVEHGDVPTVDALRALLVDVYGSDFGVHDVTWISRFTDAARQAASYREGRVLLAGDAAHVHSPAGGQGLNLGVQDAVNLGWKLGRVARGLSPETLLDSYHAERHPVGARVLRTTMAATALQRGDARSSALRDAMTELLAMHEPRRRYVATLSGLDVHYALGESAGEAHPLLGRRLPDLALETNEGSTRVLALLRRARPLLLRFEGDALDPGARASELVQCDARAAPSMVIPLLGAVPCPPAVLVRPDGHVAWVGDGTARGLHDALARDRM